MRDITESKDRFALYYAKKYCNVGSTSSCPSGEQCACAVAAEILAYKQSVIPEPYYKYKLDDFNGLSDDGKPLLEDEVTKNAKQRFLDYCYRGVKLEKYQELADKPLVLASKSIMSERLKNGINVVIFANKDNWKSGQPRKGRTLLASLIMSEAISKRSEAGATVQTYEWIQYSMLKYMLKKDDPAINTIKTCDWLVVDDVTADQNSSKASQSFFSQLLDTFFMERLTEKLPTILVFRFDPSTSVNMSEEFGVAFNKIVNDQRTFTINLGGQ